MPVLRSIMLFAFAAVALYADDWAKTFDVTGTPDVRIETDDGSVTMRSGAEGKIVARVVTTGWKIGPGEVTVREFQNGGHVEIVVRCPRTHFGFSVINRSVRVEIEVPRRTAADI